MGKVPKSKNKELKTLGARIEAERTRLGMTQQELADKLFIKREKITRIETDIPGRNLSVQELEMLADIFNVSMDYLLGRSASKKVDNNEISKVLGLDDNAIEIFVDIKENKRSNLLNHLLASLELDDVLASIAEYANTTYLHDNIRQISSILTSSFYDEEILSKENIEKIKNLYDEYKTITNSYTLQTLKFMDTTEEIKDLEIMIKEISKKDFNIKNVSTGWLMKKDILPEKLAKCLSILLYEINTTFMDTVEVIPSKKQLYFSENSDFRLMKELKENKLI